MFISSWLTALMMFLLMQNTIAAAEMSSAETTLSVDNGSVSLPPAYPGWLERQTRVEIVPPPPSGPYLSTGLRDADRKLTHAPLLTNRPWPERRHPSQQWLPESGPYSYGPGYGVDVPGFMRPDPWQAYGNQRPRPQPMWQPMYQRPQAEYE